MRTRILIAVMALLGVSSLTGAGAGEINPNWFNTPTKGPSPNNGHTVGNEDGGECTIATRAAGITVLGGTNGPLTQVNVHLNNKEETGLVKSESFTPDGSGDWSGLFEIPEGLAPGTYRLEAECAPAAEVRSGAFGSPISLGGQPVVFSYEDRFYTVVAPAEEPEPVEGDVSFTG